MQRRFILILSLVLVIVLLAGTAFANLRAISRAWIVDENGEVVPYKSSTLQQLHTANEFSKTSVNQTFFDFTINYYEVVSNDSIQTGDPRRNRALQIEQTINYWADAFYEASNGQHKLGTVTIYQGDRMKDQTDIIWEQRGHPSAWDSGYMRPAWKMYMYDIFENGNGNTDLTFIDDDPANNRRFSNAQAGFTMAHETGHFVYGMFDEYVHDQGNHDARPQSTDVEPDGATIMNNQFEALHNGYGWLNFSTRLNYSIATRTAHRRVFGMSAWETLVRATSADNFNSDRPRVVYYFEDSNKPLSITSPDYTAPADSDHKIQLTGSLGNNPAAPNGQGVRIVWVPDDEVVVYQIVIDRSGSMAGARINNARRAAIQLVDSLTPDVSAVGVVQFNESTQQIHNITLITSDDQVAIKNEINNKIRALTASGNTAIYDAALRALTTMQQSPLLQGTSGITLLITDGEDNSSTATWQNVVTAYNNARIPISIVNYGGDAQSVVLQSITAGTGGDFYASPATAEALLKVTLDTVNKASGGQTLRTYDSINISADSSIKLTFNVESGLGNIRLIVSHPLTRASFDVTFTSPGGVNGTLIPGASLIVTDLTGDTMHTLFVNQPQTGEWSVEIRNKTNTNRAISAVAAAMPQIGSGGGGGKQYSIVLSTIRTENSQMVAVNSPETVLLHLKYGGHNLTGLDEIKGVLLDKLGNKVADIVFKDNGDKLAYGDSLASDGVYSALVTFPIAGDYTIEVQLNVDKETVRTTKLGILRNNNKAPWNPISQTFQASFSRLATLSLIAAGTVDKQIQPFIRAARPVIVSPSGKNISGGTIEFEASAFSASNGNTMIKSEWIVNDEYGRKKTYTSDNNKVGITFNEDQPYSVIMTYLYENNANPGEVFITAYSDSVLINDSSGKGKGSGGCNSGVGSLVIIACLIIVTALTARRSGILRTDR